MGAALPKCVILLSHMPLEASRGHLTHQKSAKSGYAMQKNLILFRLGPHVPLQHYALYDITTSLIVMRVPPNLRNAFAGLASGPFVTGCDHSCPSEWPVGHMKAPHSLCFELHGLFGPLV